MWWAKPWNLQIIPDDTVTENFSEDYVGLGERWHFGSTFLHHGRSFDISPILTLASGHLESTCFWWCPEPKPWLRKLRKKINKHAFSGGGKTEEEQRANGANLDVDVAYQ